MLLSRIVKYYTTLKENIVHGTGRGGTWKAVHDKYLRGQCRLHGIRIKCCQIYSEQRSRAGMHTGDPSPSRTAGDRVPAYGLETFTPMFYPWGHKTPIQMSDAQHPYGDDLIPRPSSQATSLLNSTITQPREIVPCEVHASGLKIKIPTFPQIFTKIGHNHWFPTLVNISIMLHI